jgi:nucleoid-associated protein YgaU
MRKQTLKKLLKLFKSYEEKMSMVLGMAVVLFVAATSIWFFQSLRRQNSQTATEQLPLELSTDQQLPELSQLPSQRNFVEQEGKFFPESLPVIYVVQTGDSTWNIAQAFYGSGENYIDIERENNLTADQDVVQGQKLKIPRVPTKLDLSEMKKVSPIPVTVSPNQSAPAVVSRPNSHTVKPGEGLWQIAQQHYGDGNQYLRIFEANKNQMKSPEDIRVGMTLTLPE